MAIRGPWRAVSAMFVLNGALFGIWASRVPAVAQMHGLEPGRLGMLLLLTALGAILSFPLAGRGSDRVGAYKVTWVTAFIYLAGLTGLALAPSVALLGVALFVYGIGHGAMDVAMNAWAGEVERRGGRSIMASFHAMWSLGAGLGAASGWLAVKLGAGVAPHFLIAGAAVAVVTLWFARIGWQSDIAHHHDAPVFAFPKGALILVGFIAMGSAIGEGGMADWSAIFLVKTAGVGEARAALGYAVFSAVMVIMRFAGDRAILRFGPVTMARAAGLSAATGVALAVGFGTYPVALVGFALMGLGYALVIPLAFSRAANDPEVPPGQAIASVSTLGYGGILLGPPLIGFMAQAFSIRVAFGWLGVLALMVTLLAPALRRRQA